MQLIASQAYSDLKQVLLVICHICFVRSIRSKLIYTLFILLSSHLDFKQQSRLSFFNYCRSCFVDLTAMHIERVVILLSFK